MRTSAVFLSLTLLAAGLWGASPAAAQYGADARIWVDNDREYFRHGDRLRVNFRTSADSYVAVVHVDPDGYLDFVFPRSPWDNDFVRGGRSYSLSGGGWSNGLVVRGGGGIGYLYVIASPVPLDYSRFRSGRGSPWDWSYAGRRVSGDPFWAMEQITRMLLPGWGNVPYAVDYYTYFIGGRQRYPSYACSNYGGGLGWGSTAVSVLRLLELWRRIGLGVQLGVELLLRRLQPSGPVPPGQPLLLRQPTLPWRSALLLPRVPGLSRLGSATLLQGEPGDARISSGRPRAGAARLERYGATRPPAVGSDAGRDPACAACDARAVARDAGTGAADDAAGPGAPLSRTGPTHQSAGARACPTGTEPPARAASPQRHPAGGASHAQHLSERPSVGFIRRWILHSAAAIAA